MQIVSAEKIDPRGLFLSLAASLCLRASWHLLWLRIRSGVIELLIDLVDKARLNQLGYQ